MNSASLAQSTCGIGWSTANTKDRRRRKTTENNGKDERSFPNVILDFRKKIALWSGLWAITVDLRVK